MNLVSFAFVDTTMAGATLALKYSRHFEPKQEGVRAIPLRAKLGDAFGNTELFDGWPFARRLLDDVADQLRARLGAPQALEFGEIFIEELAAGHVIPWQIGTTDYDKAHTRARLQLLPSCGVSLYSGNDTLAPGVGNLTFINHLVWHSVVNLGTVPAISLVLDVKKPPTQ